ncbi:MAG: flagellar M-ring protein FliF [Treponema sp.]|nr:flagellar M-ring protein FliF [Treponema sp.]
MNEWLKQTLANLKDKWSKWKPVQKVIVLVIIAAVIVAIVLAARTSSKPSTVRLFDAPVTSEESRNKILDRINLENINATFTDEGYIEVEDEATKRRVRNILISENLVPSNIDVWANYYDRSWSTTDADQNVKLKNTIQKQLKQHIEAIDGVTTADVNLVIPETSLFSSTQNPVTASIILKTNTNSDILTNRTKILGIQRLVLTAVEGLTADNIIITDSFGEQINDFEGMAEIDRVDIVAKQEKLKQKQAAKIRADVLNALQKTYSEDRCRDIVVSVDMDMSKKQTDSTIYSPIVIKEDNPDTPYDDSEYRDVLPISQQTVTREWQGTGYNPEGPAGVEGQTPPVYSDMSNVVGRSVETGVTQNNVINTKQVSEETAPKIDRVSVAANLDGIWTLKLKKDAKTGQVIQGAYEIGDDGYRVREYTPISEEELKKTEDFLKAAVGYDRSRGDTVAVTNIRYDRTEEFRAEDQAFFAIEQRRKTILLVLVALAIIMVGFILFRVISKELERRRKKREAEELERRRRETEEALWNAKEENEVVSMSVEESRRLELQENAVAMAKEHPEEVALLIRTWLMEE